MLKLPCQQPRWSTECLLVLTIFHKETLSRGKYQNWTLIQELNNNWAKPVTLLVSKVGYFSDFWGPVNTEQLASFPYMHNTDVHTAGSYIFALIRSSAWYAQVDLSSVLFPTDLCTLWVCVIWWHFLMGMFLLVSLLHPPTPYNESSLIFWKYKLFLYSAFNF